MFSRDRIVQRAADLANVDEELRYATPCKLFAAALAPHIEADLAGALHQRLDFFDIALSLLLGNMPEKCRTVKMEDLTAELCEMLGEGGLEYELRPAFVVRVLRLQSLRRRRALSNHSKDRLAVPFFGDIISSSS